jgi:hypothetical protein
MILQWAELEFVIKESILSVEQNQRDVADFNYKSIVHYGDLG